MRNFILGTDWGTDVDDVVALRLLTRAARAGKIALRGVVINDCREYSVDSLKGFLAYDGMDDVPVGIDREADDYLGNPPYQKKLASTLGKGLTNDDGEDAVRLYRRILASSSEPVEIVEIGFLQAVAALLKSEPDDISEMPGVELVREKVAKFWVMAGKWDEDGGWEYNFAGAPRSRVGAHAFCELCPVPITFLGFEVGESVISGGSVGADDPLHVALDYYGMPNGRSSWDPMTVTLALRADELESDYDKVVGTATVDEESGRCHFTVDPLGKHAYVVKKRDDSYYAELINSAIV